MPTLSEKHKILSGLNQKDADAIVAVIELKTDENMDKVLNKLELVNQRLDLMSQQLNTRMDSMEERFDSRLNSMEKSVDARLDAMNNKIDTKINTLYWVVGLGVTIAVAAIKLL